MLFYNSSFTSHSFHFSETNHLKNLNPYVQSRKIKFIFDQRAPAPYTESSIQKSSNFRPSDFFEYEQSLQNLDLLFNCQAVTALFNETLKKLQSASLVIEITNRITESDVDISQSAALLQIGLNKVGKFALHFLSALFSIQDLKNPHSHRYQLTKLLLEKAPISGPRVIEMFATLETARFQKVNGLFQQCQRNFLGLNQNDNQALNQYLKHFSHANSEHLILEHIINHRVDKALALWSQGSRKAYCRAYPKTDPSCSKTFDLGANKALNLNRWYHFIRESKIESFLEYLGRFFNHSKHSPYFQRYLDVAFKNCLLAKDFKRCLSIAFKTQNL